MLNEFLEKDNILLAVILRICPSHSSIHVVLALKGLPFAAMFVVGSPASALSPIFHKWLDGIRTHDLKESHSVAMGWCKRVNWAN